MIKKYLPETHPHLLEEWDKNRNETRPEDVSYGSHKKVWWVCSDEDCKHSWKASVGNRTNRIRPRDCPVCAIGPVSKISQKWLDGLNISTLKKEYTIKDLSFRVDGFDPKTNTVYEFLGDYWHGNPEVYLARKINPSSKKSFGKLHQETLDRFRLLEGAGYKVIYIWEKDYKVEYGKEER